VEWDTPSKFVTSTELVNVRSHRVLNRENRPQFTRRGGTDLQLGGVASTTARSRATDPAGAWHRPAVCFPRGTDQPPWEGRCVLMPSSGGGAGAEPLHCLSPSPLKTSRHASGEGVHCGREGMRSFRPRYRSSGSSRLRLPPHGSPVLLRTGFFLLSLRPSRRPPAPQRGVADPPGDPEDPRRSGVDPPRRLVDPPGRAVDPTDGPVDPLRHAVDPPGRVVDPPSHPEDPPDDAVRARIARGGQASGDGGRITRADVGLLAPGASLQQAEADQGNGSTRRRRDCRGDAQVDEEPETGGVVD
jgi:hypothetical protein